MKFLFNIWVLKVMADYRSKKLTCSPNKRKRYSASLTDCNENIFKNKKEVCAEKMSDAKNKRNWNATLSGEKKQWRLRVSLVQFFVKVHNEKVKFSKSA